MEVVINCLGQISRGESLFVILLNGLDEYFSSQRYGGFLWGKIPFPSPIDSCNFLVIFQLKMEQYLLKPEEAVVKLLKRFKEGRFSTQ